jgi:N-acyl-D-aspartate/D-glutamate deacylase
MGNCALALALVQPTDHDALVQSFVRVEAMPRAALEAGVPWGWHTFGDYLAALEGRLGINVGGPVGHIAARQYVLGDAADLVVLNSATVRAGEPEWVQDCPARTKRLIQPSTGVEVTVVNGRVIYEGGRLSGDLPGQVVRNRLAARQPVAA